MIKEITDSELLLKISAAVSYQFPNDRSCPSVLVSTLKNGKIYTSIVRYGDFKKIDYTGIKGKLVVCYAQGNSLRESLTKLSKNFLNFVKENRNSTNPLEALNNLFEASPSKSLGDELDNYASEDDDFRF